MTMTMTGKTRYMPPPLDFEHAYSECPLCTFFVSQNNILLLSFAAFASVKLQRKTLVRWEILEHNWMEFILKKHSKFHRKIYGMCFTC